MLHYTVYPSTRFGGSHYGERGVKPWLRNIHSQEGVWALIMIDYEGEGWGTGVENGKKTITQYMNDP